MPTEPLLGEWRQRSTPAVLDVMEEETEAGQASHPGSWDGATQRVEGACTWDLLLALSWPALPGQC